MPYVLTFTEFVKRIQRGRIFTITFKKRTTGEIRTMNCRINVDKYLAGGDLNYNPLDKGLFVVWDLQKGEYRQIPMEGILHLAMGGIRYDYNPDKQEFVQV